MEMILIKVCLETDIVNMITIPNGNGLSCYSSKPVIVRILFTFGDQNAALNLMNMPLVAAAFILFIIVLPLMIAPNVRIRIDRISFAIIYATV
jgi:hypothetical protein